MDSPLLAISDRRQLQEPLEAWMARLAAAGVGALQLREKDLGGAALLEAALRARETLGRGVRLLVNGRADVALLCGADGVHLPASGLPVAALRRWFGERLLIGRSTHTIDEVVAAHEAGVDYVTFGPVYPTPSKRAYGPPPGLEGLRRAARVGLPVFALGGVTIERLPEVAAAGARGAAGIRIFLDPGRLPELTEAAARAFPSTPR